MGKRSCRKPTEVAVSQGTLYLATGIRVDDTGSVHGYFGIRYETIFIWPESRKTWLKSNMRYERNVYIKIYFCVGGFCDLVKKKREGKNMCQHKNIHNSFNIGFCWFSMQRLFSIQIRA